MINNNNNNNNNIMNAPNKLYNQNNNIVNRRRLFPQDRQRINNPELNKNIPNFNSNLNNRNNNNINQNRINNINNNENNELSKAFLIIQRELKKKDNRILELERKIQDLTNKINSYTNNNNNDPRIPKPSSMMEERNDLYNNNPDEDKDMFNNNLNKNVYNYGYIAKNKNQNLINFKANNIRSNSHQKTFQVKNLNYNSDSENIPKRFQGYDNLSYSNDNSVLTYNGVHSTNSKKDVKDYLKEVKAKIEPKKFKEFIRNIKLLTAKSEIAPNKENIVESMRILFGKEHLDLFLRFEKIIGAGK